jgi:hypothetical protein
MSQEFGTAAQAFKAFRSFVRLEFIVSGNKLHSVMGNRSRCSFFGGATATFANDKAFILFAEGEPIAHF